MLEESISSITESADGYIWAATREGLVRFDGRGFRTFAPGEKAGLRDHGLGAVAASDSVLWVAGREYISYSPTDAFQSFTGLRFETTLFPRAPGDRYGVANISPGMADREWILWRTDGVYSLPEVPNAKMVLPKLVHSPPPGETLLGFHEGHSGRRWIVTASGLKLWDRDHWRPLRATPDGPCSMIEARDGSLWIYTQSRVEQLSPSGTKEYKVAPSIKAGGLQSILEDRDGAIWIGSVGQALRITSGKLERLSLDNHVHHDDLIQTLHQSRDGAIWMGSRMGVLIRVEEPVFRTIGSADGVLGTTVASVQKDVSGRIWIGSRTGGVFVQDGARWRRVPGTDDRIHQALAPLRDGRIIGVDSYGVWLSDGWQIRTVISRADTSLGAFRSLSPDYGDHIYFSDPSGIYRLRLPEATAATKISDIAAVRSLIEAEDGLWAISWESGVVHIAGGQTSKYPLPAGVANRGMTLKPLTSRLLLVGTNNGVLAFDRAARVFIKGRVLFHNEQIFFIQEDDSGNLWFAGRRGLLSASRTSVTGYLEGYGASVAPIRFGGSQGLISANFGLGTSAIAAVAGDGELWLASQGGAIHFRPSAVISGTANVRCAIEDILADGASVPHEGTIRLSPGTKRVRIDYTVLQRKAGENPLFRYRLLGDESWTESGEFQAAYTNLKPGSYRFQLQARVAALSWSSAVTTLDFEVIPFWYQRTGVRLAASITLLLAVVAGVRIRGARTRRENEILEQRVRARTEELAHARDQAERLRERAEAAARAKSEFLSNMSHEIRTPLNGVIGTTELALQTDLSETQRELLSIAKVSADSLLLLINDVLDFSKIEAGKMLLDPAPFDLRQTLQESLKMVTTNAQSKAIDLCLSISPGVPEQLLGDAGRLRQILLNLLGNAVKFTKKGTVSLAVEVERLLENDAILHFAVRDTGIGIPHDMREKIFQAFEQVDGTITRRYGGTGLGLAISSNLVRLMDGHIWLESEVGKGSTFHFTIRAGRAEGLLDAQDPGAAEPVYQENPLDWPARILLAEDNPINELVAVRLLKARGYEVTAVRNGLQAIDAWQRHAFDLLLLDVQMPEMDGIETTHEIRRRENGNSRVPIIALTAGAFAEDRSRCIAAGMNDFVAKPIAPVEFYDVLHRWLSQKAEDNTVSIPAPS